MRKIITPSRVSIDLGGQKISCLIAQGNSKDNLSIQGFGSAVSRGIFAGQLDDISLLKKSIMSAVCDAEIQSKKRVRQAVLTLSGGFFKSEHASLRSFVQQSFVSEKDIKNMMHRIKRPGLVPLHIVPLFFSVDQQKNIQNPCGMAGQSLVGHFHILWAQDNFLKTLHSFFKECNIQLTDVIAGCVSDAFFCFDADERNAGVTLINMGANYTTASVFKRGKLYDQVTVPMGGQDITEDIARSYAVKFFYAERVKKSFGAALINLEHYHKNIPIFFSEKKAQTDLSIPYASLVDVVQSRCEKILHHLRVGMQKSPHFPSMPVLYLTGGGSHLVGIGELCQRFFGRSVRIVEPHLFQKFPHHSNAITSVFGGLVYQESLMFQKKPITEKNHGIIKPFFSWIKKLC